jgi:outer membrane protein insertion porin family/translocation and assembly module TamA
MDGTRKLTEIRTSLRNFAGWRLGRLVLLASCISALLPANVTAQASARDTLPVVRKIHIEGNEAFSDQEIRRAIATTSSGCKSVFLSPLCWIGLDVFKNTARLVPRELTTDVARLRVFYFRRGYRLAQVDTAVTRDDGTVEVTFIVDEGEPVIVRSLEVQGLEEVDGASDIVAGISLRPGQPFSELALTVSRGQIERDLGNSGYADAVVLVDAMRPAEDSMGAQVVLKAIPGPRYTIGNIEVDGAVEIAPDDVLRLLSFHSGDVYSLEEIVRSQRNLYSMALFDYVDVQSEPVSGDTVVDVRVQVNEAKLRGVQFGAGISTTECITLQAGWANRNFFGGTRKLEINGVLSNIATSRRARQFPCTQAGVARDGSVPGDSVYNQVNWLLRVDFRQPWFLGTENWLHLGLFADRISLPAVYVSTSIGGDVRFSREISVGTAVSASYRPSLNELQEGSADFLFCANFLICDPADIAILEERRWLSPVTLTFAQGRTDAVLDPSRGYRLTVEGEYASRFTGSGWTYVRAQGEVAWYRRMGLQAVLALRMRGGVLRPVGSGIEGVDLTPGSEALTHPLKRMYAGGAYTVRGFQENLLGPKVLLTSRENIPLCEGNRVTDENTLVCDPNQSGLRSEDAVPRPVGGQNSLVANAEVRMPLGSENWRAVVFVDMGRVWSSGGEVPEAERFAWSPGFGIRYLSPVGPLRLDIGFNTISGGEPLPVVTELEDEFGQSQIVQLGTANNQAIPFLYKPFEGKSVFSRMTLHFSIGHAF